jgi:MerR family redox-sensitive transcriptional activator SoxR
MRIGELALRTGATPKAVRYYERLGFVKSRRTPSDYRDFDNTAIDVISTIRSAQRLGVKLSEMDEIIALIRDQMRPCASVRAVISAKRREVRERIASLKQFASFLRRLEVIGEDGDAPCPILSSTDMERR